MAEVGIGRRELVRDCWWIFWDNRAKADCIYAAMTAGFPGCADCTVTAR